MLPKIEDPILTFTLPSSGADVRFRPFRVKDEKLLLMAKDSQEQKDIMNAILQMVGNCAIDGDVDVRKLPYFDIEYLFIKLRTASVGSTIKFKVNNNEAIINLDDIVVRNLHEKIDSIEIANGIHFIMTYPTVADLVDITDSVDSQIEAATRCVRSVTNGDSIEDFKSMPIEKRVEYIENLPPSKFALLTKFLSTMPKVVVEAKYIDNKTKTEKVHEVEGLRNFL